MVDIYFNNNTRRILGGKDNGVTPLHYVKVEKWAKKCATLKTFFSMDVDARGTKF